MHFSESILVAIALVAWFGLAIIPAAIARWKGRSSNAWYLVSVLTSPTLAIVVLLMLPREDAGVPQVVWSQKCLSCSAPAHLSEKTCWRCGELLSGKPAVSFSHTGVPIWPAAVFTIVFISSLVLYGIHIMR